MPQKHTKTSPIMTSLPPKHKPFNNDSDDDDGVKGFTLRLTQVQVSEEKKTANIPQVRWGNNKGSSAKRRGSVAFMENEMEEENAYMETRVNTIVGANGGFTLKSSNKKRKIINVVGSPTLPRSSHKKSNAGNSSSIR